MSNPPDVPGDDASNGCVPPSPSNTACAVGAAKPEPPEAAGNGDESDKEDTVVLPVSVALGIVRLIGSVSPNEAGPPLDCNTPGVREIAG